MQQVRRSTLPVMVAEEIRRDIIHKKLKPGNRLPTELQLTKQLGVGRPTLREALRILQGQGWIRFQFGEGAYVMDNPKVSQKTSEYLRKEEVLELLEHEITQLEQEGKDVAGTMVREIFQRLRKEGSPEEVEEFYDSLERLNERVDYPYEEPSEMEAIEKETSGQNLILPEVLDKDALCGRIYGAWLGRCIGCVMGKPVEGWTKVEIEKYLRATGSYPLQDYFPYEPDEISSNESVLHSSAKETTAGNVEHMPRDDDLDYTILNLKLIAENGPEFTTDDVAEAWLMSFPYRMIYTAERQAYANLVRGFKAPATAIHRNPFREWIGAQIRGDVFGYVAPGNPELAASFAHRDGRLSHTKNGIYGEMFVAACISASLVTSDLDTAIGVGLSQVPKNSRLAELVENVTSWSKEAKSWQEVWQRVRNRYGGYDYVHTLPNLAYVLIGLIYGELDFRKTVSIAVMCGYDTDCNGATAGSILGALRGIEAIPEEMSKPLNDRIRSAVFGYSDARISHLAKRTLELATRIQ